MNEKRATNFYSLKFNLLKFYRVCNILLFFKIFSSISLNLFGLKIFKIFKSEKKKIYLF